jgi:hypothetical protein
MKKLLALMLVVSWVLLSFNIVLARVRVKGYYRKDGTYVAPHYRSDPDGNPYNNYSYPGNYNPNTGETTKGNQNTYLSNYYLRRSKSRVADNYGNLYNNYNNLYNTNKLYDSNKLQMDNQFNNLNNNLNDYLDYNNNLTIPNNSDASNQLLDDFNNQDYFNYGNDYLNKFNNSGFGLNC